MAARETVNLLKRIYFLAEFLFMSLSIEESNFKAGNYYRCTKECDDFKPGDLVLILQTRTDHITFFLKESDTRTRSRSFFEENFVFEPNGKALREEEKTRLIDEAQSVVEEIGNINDQIENISLSFDVKALPNAPEEEIKTLAESGMQSAGELTIAEDATTGETGITRTGKDLIETMKKFGGGIADIRNELLEKQAKLSSLKARIGFLQAEQSALLNAMFMFKDKTEKLQEAIKTICLYLGTGERIEQLRHGKFASAEDKLVIRQLKLFADEECAISAEKGGIDHRTIEKFDDWLLADAKNLDQVLPERKGIIAIQPRRDPKDRHSTSAAKEDLKTYFLIRNGENLFRICTEFEVGERLFPNRREFEEYFYETDFSLNADDAGRRKPMQTGSSSFNRAVKQMNSQQREYAKTLIVLQGLVDRTGIFPELQQAGVNLIDLEQNFKYVVYISDADPASILTNGKETFRNWQSRTNNELKFGDRVIGLWYKTPWNSDRGHYERIFPKNLEPPSSEEIYVLEKEDSGGFRFLFDRGEVYDRDSYTYKQSEKRASCKIYPRDQFLLSFDRISLEQVEYFLNDRLSRSAYLDMFPLLKLVRKLKREEREIEKPFIELLAGEFLKIDEDSTIEAHRARAAEFLTWWKFKNRVTRALLSDDGKALRMILKAFRGQAKDGGSSISEQHAQLIGESTILIGEHNNRLFAIERFDDDRIFVNIAKYEMKKGELSLISESREVYIGGKWELWKILYAHADWKSWAKDKKGDFLTGDELNGFIKSHKESVIKNQMEYMRTRERFNTDARFDGESGHLFIGTKITDERTIEFYYYSFIRDRRVIRPGNITINKICMKWKRKGRKIELEKFFREEETNNKTIDKLIESYFEQKSWIPSKNSDHWIEFVLTTDQKSEIKILESGFVKYRTMLQALSELYFSGIKPMVEEVNRQHEETAFRKYLSEFGDARNWKHSRDLKKLGKLYFERIKGENYFRYLVLTGILSLAELPEMKFSDFRQLMAIENLKKLDYEKFNCSFFDHLENTFEMLDEFNADASNGIFFDDVRDAEFYKKSVELVDDFFKNGDFVKNNLPSFSVEAKEADSEVIRKKIVNL